MQGVSVYKPNNDPKKGSAIQFHPSFMEKKNSFVLMVEAVNQSGPKPAPGSTDSPFNWADKIKMMLDPQELAQINAVITRIDSSDKIDILHSIEKDGVEVISKLSLKRPGQNDKYGNWGLSFSQTHNYGGGQDKSNTLVNLFLAPSEIYMLKQLNDCILSDMFMRKRNVKTKS